MALDAEDLALIKQAAASVAFKMNRPDMKDDFVSESCFRLLKKELPDESVHRQRFIRQTVGWSATDCIRRVTVTPRRTIEKIKKNIPLSAKERQKIGSLQGVDFSEDWIKEVAAPVEVEKPDVCEMLSRIGASHPVEFFVLVMQFVHGANLSAIGGVLEMTESRACQISKKGIALLKRRVLKQYIS